MRILIIRHGDPDYEKDSLTEKGWREASLLADKLEKEDLTRIYVSPLGRAKDTASLTLERKGTTAEERPWLREFAAQINRPDVTDRKKIAWDWLPEDWTAEPDHYLTDKWMDTPVMKAGDVKEQYQWVTDGLDALLAEHGYVRDGKNYRVEQANRNTIVFFCHFGVECVLLSHLMNISPMVLWHHTCAAPSSVTTIYTEERRKGTAIFRISSLADQSHLYAGGEAPSPYILCIRYAFAPSWRRGVGGGALYLGCRFALPQAMRSLGFQPALVASYVVVRLFWLRSSPLLLVLFAVGFGEAVAFGLGDDGVGAVVGVVHYEAPLVGVVDGLEEHL